MAKHTDADTDVNLEPGAPGLGDRDLTTRASLPYKIVGHRGNPEHFPENSLAGFKSAAALGLDAIELDVQLSADGVCVVIHDIDTLRTSNQAMNVALTRFSDLRAVSVHEPARFGEQHYPSAIASLKQVCEVLRDFQGLIFIELKEECYVTAEGVATGTYSRKDFLFAALAESEIVAAQRVIISFDEKMIALAKATDKVPVGWVMHRYDARHKVIAEQLQPNFLCVNERKIPADGSPLWPGDWQWFLYDIVESKRALATTKQGAVFIESWDPSNLA